MRVTRSGHIFRNVILIVAMLFFFWVLWFGLPYFFGFSSPVVAAEQFLNEIGLLHTQRSHDLPACVNVYCKPAVYLYPTQKSLVTVRLPNTITLTASLPIYRGSWQVLASPEGSLLDLASNQLYPYLYWEGKPLDPMTYDLTTGFVVFGSETKEFLQQSLNSLGLTTQESNEFIAYWEPRLSQNHYNLIHFATEDEYASKLPLDIDPKPDSILRILMVYQPLEKQIIVEPQKLPQFKRKGFAVVEWGGVEKL